MKKTYRIFYFICVNGYAELDSAVSVTPSSLTTRCASHRGVQTIVCIFQRFFLRFKETVSKIVRQLIFMIQSLKGHTSQDFLRPVFFMIRTYLGPWCTGWSIFKFGLDFAEIFEFKKKTSALCIPLRSQNAKKYIKMHTAESKSKSLRVSGCL